MIHSVLDQALGLRRLMKPAGVRVLPVFGTQERLPAIVNLATALARAGQRVLVMDASRGEIAPAFGLRARYELKHVLEGEIAFSQAVLSTRDGVQVLPAARGIRMLSEARVSAMDFFESFAEKAAPIDLIVVNCETANRVARLLPVHGEALLVLSHGPTTLVDGVMCLKSLVTQQAMTRFRLLMMHTAFEQARLTANRLSQLAYDKLDVDVVFGGSAPAERALQEAARARRTIFDIDPAGAVARSFHNAAAGVTDWDLAVVGTIHTVAGAADSMRTVAKLH